MAAALISSETASPKERLLYIDNLRLLVIVYPIAKWALLCVICIPLCFAATYFVFRRIPLLKKML